MRLTLAITVFLVYLLHQDFWFWRTPFPLLFGFLPAGLVYHAGYSLLTCSLMIVLVKWAWPSRLEETADSPSSSTEDSAR